MEDSFERLHIKEIINLIEKKYIKLGILLEGEGIQVKSRIGLKI